MDKGSLADGKRGLEEAFFAEQDAGLLRRLREADALRESRDALSAASGVTDPEVLDKLASAGITVETVTALSLIPMVAVAWADGAIDAKEKDAALASAEQHGLVKGDTAYRLFAGWLERRPPADLLEVWQHYTKALSSVLDERERAALQAEILGRARAVAEAASSLMGFGPRISAAERAVLSRLERAFTA